MAKTKTKGKPDLEPKEWLMGHVREHGEVLGGNPSWSTEELIQVLEAYDTYLTSECIRIMTEASIDALKERRK